MVVLLFRHSFLVLDEGSLEELRMAEDAAKPFLSNIAVSDMLINGKRRQQFASLRSESKFV
jgi:hypothetical protein